MYSNQDLMMCLITCSSYFWEESWIKDKYPDNSCNLDFVSYFTRCLEQRKSYIELIMCTDFKFRESNNQKSLVIDLSNRILKNKNNKFNQNLYKFLYIPWKKDTFDFISTMLSSGDYTIIHLEILYSKLFSYVLLNRFKGL